MNSKEPIVYTPYPEYFENKSMRPEDEKHFNELITLENLKKNLNSEYVIYHSVNWRDHFRIGEIDFIIINKKTKKILMIEQKNITKEQTYGGKINYSGKTTDVSHKINRSKEAMKKNLVHEVENTYKNEIYKYLGCVLFLPKGKIAKEPLGLEKGIDFATNIEELKKIIFDFFEDNRAIPDWISFEKLDDFLKDELKYTIDIQSQITDKRRVFKLHSNELKRIISNIEINPLRLKVVATAGSGKSNLAFWFYEKSIKEGKNPLLLCYNRELNDYFKRKLEKAIPDKLHNCYTFHEFCKMKLEATKGEKIKISDGNKTNDFNKVVQDLLREIKKSKNKFIEYDLLIVDEGQDFEADWYVVATSFVKGEQKKAELIWLEDPNQMIAPNKNIPSLENIVTYNHKYNYRTPKEIANFISLLFEKLGNKEIADFESKSAFSGEIYVHPYSDSIEQIKLSGDIIEELLSRKFKKDQINIVSLESFENSPFVKHNKVGPFTLNRLTSPKGEWDEKEQEYKKTGGDINFNSIGRYKGLERNVIILTDITDPKPEKQKRYFKKLYCGLTRSSWRVDLLVDAKSDIYKAIVGS